MPAYSPADTKINLCTWTPDIALAEPLPELPVDPNSKTLQKDGPRKTRQSESHTDSLSSSTPGNSDILLREHFFSDYPGLKILSPAMPFYMIRAELPEVKSERASARVLDAENPEAIATKTISDGDRIHTVQPTSMPLKIKVTLSLASFSRSLVHEEKNDDLCIYVYYNGELAASRVIESKITKDPFIRPREMVQEFGGHRFGTQSEIPFVLDLSQIHSNSPHLQSEKWNTSRWNQIQTAILAEARRWQNSHGKYHAMSEYLTELADITMPTALASSDVEECSKLGVIDVVIVTGTAQAGSRPLCHSLPYRYRAEERIGNRRRKVTASDDIGKIYRASSGKVTFKYGYIATKDHHDLELEQQPGTPATPSPKMIRFRRPISSTRSNPAPEAFNEQPAYRSVLKPAGSLQTITESPFTSQPQVKADRRSQSSRQNASHAKRRFSQSALGSEMESPTRRPKKMSFALRPQNRRRKDADGKWYIPPIDDETVARFDKKHKKLELAALSELDSPCSDSKAKKNTTGRLLIAFRNTGPGRYMARRVNQKLSGKRKTQDCVGQFDGTDDRSDNETQKEQPATEIKDDPLSVRTLHGEPNSISTLTDNPLCFRRPSGSEPLTRSSDASSSVWQDSSFTAFANTSFTDTFTPLTSFSTDTSEYAIVRLDENPASVSSRSNSSYSWAASQEDSQTTGASSSAFESCQRNLSNTFDTPFLSQQDLSRDVLGSTSNMYGPENSYPLPMDLDHTTTSATVSQTGGDVLHLGDAGVTETDRDRHPHDLVHLPPQVQDSAPPPSLDTGPSMSRCLFTKPTYPPFRVKPEENLRGVPQGGHDPRLTDAWMPTSLCRDSVLTYASTQQWGEYYLSDPPGQVCRRVREENEIAFRAVGIVMGVRFILGG